MTTVDSATAAFTGASTTLASSSSTVSDDFTTFIELLVAQVQNQDPLEPADSTQFVEQLATFSALEQQVATNDNLESIGALISDLHAMVASEWLGETVAVETKHLPYEGGDVEFKTSVETGSDSAELVIQTMDGETVWSEKVDASDTSVSWDGKTLNGQAVPAGTLLAVSLENYLKGEHTSSKAAEVITKVTSVGNEYGKVRLETEMNLATGLDDVQKIN